MIKLICMEFIASSAATILEDRIWLVPGGSNHRGRHPRDPGPRGLVRAEEHFDGLYA